MARRRHDPPGHAGGFTRLSGFGRSGHSGSVPDDLLHRAITLAAPLFAIFVVVMVIIQLAATRLHRCRRVDTASTVVTIVSAGAFAGAKVVVGKLAALAVALYVYEHWRLATLDLTNPLVWIGAIIVRDLVYYGVHRSEHRFRLLWASHQVHHSPMTIDFTTAIRVPWMEAVYKPWFGLWVPLIGINPVAFIIADVTAGVIGQLCHTRRVRRLAVVEWLFVTPSAHRVHHGSNPEYIDKNFGAVFIVWDRLFGTFEEETTDVVYGIGKSGDISVGEALTGGYPELVTTMRTLPPSSWIRHAFGAPGDPFTARSDRAISSRTDHLRSRPAA